MPESDVMAAGQPGSGALAGKVALITGAAGFIGRATAAVLASRGARIVAVDRPGADLGPLRAAIVGDAPVTVEADVTDEGGVARYVETALTISGRIDIFFNNAGIEGPQAAIPDYPAAEFRRILDVNVTGVFLGLQAVMPVMIAQQEGSIINTSSIAGLVGSATMAGYVASKHAVLGLTRVAALEGAPHGVRVNSIHPGFIESRMLSDIIGRMGGQDTEFAAMVPAKRLGTADEIARAVAFLAGDDSRYMNGSAMVIDGGLTVA